MGAEACDVLVVGSGFGGSIAALRLTEKGYRVGVLEAGRRFDGRRLRRRPPGGCARSCGRPSSGCYGIQRIHCCQTSWSSPARASAAARWSTPTRCYVPPEPFFDDPQWARITDWRAELAPYYDQATRMLGVVTNPTMTPGRRRDEAVADDMGVGHTFRSTPVGVYFGDGPGVTARRTRTSAAWAPSAPAAPSAASA